MLTPTVQVDPNSAWFPTLDQAAAAVLRALPNNGLEHAGVLLKDADGAFGYSTSVQQYQDTFALKAQITSGLKLAGIYHTHPGNDDLAGYFSPNDIDTAEQLKVPSFIRFDSNGSVRKYVPGQTRTERYTATESLIKPRIARGDELVA